MSSAPSPGWPHPTAPGPAGPVGSLRWRLLHSWWLLLPLFGCSCLGGFGFIYVGLRAGRPAWWIPGIVYTVVGWTAFVVVGETDKEAAASDWAVGALLAVTAAGILHALLVNSAWLRWRAGYRPWYAPQPGAPWPGGPYPPGPLAPPPGAAPAGAFTPATGPYPPGAPVHAPASPAYPPASPAYPPASPAFPPGPPGYPSAPAYPPSAPTHPPVPAGSQPPADPTMVPYQPVDYYGTGPVAAPVPRPGQPVTARPSGPVDVNAAGHDDLAALPGFDPHRARQVLAERDRRGGFGSLAEFAAAANLAPHEYARLRDVLVCAPPASPAPGQQPPLGRVLDV
ncbi:helix-hairpin-helix domain-containing protein [Micromonospora sp. NPDC002717]|uniref:ComEA family DNA-binding protein n=1 Tax=Micromonospora sp. NPDC002717 TaxID=3154424 RepID=UPI00332D841D